jgi:heavy metal translocating P-type ATPase
VLGVKLWLERLPLPLVLATLVAGGVAWLAGELAVTAWLWMVGTAIICLSLLVGIGLSLRRGELGLDIIAALAMAGALALGEHLAGIIVALMYTGGQALETFAQMRARREMAALLSRVPRSAARYTDDRLEEVALDAIQLGDRILVRRGDVIPVDGTLASGLAVLDESSLTGEAMPIRRRQGERVTSGATNVADAFDLVATSTAADSTYAGIVRLVEAAQAAKSPMSRLADRYALLFLLLTLMIAGAAWFASADATRALAVLVVATPCPLIIAVPVAIVSGLSRCARTGVLVKGGGALERLAEVKTVLLDKTGTVTDGKMGLVEAKVHDDLDVSQVLRLAASLDQSSQHVAARALVSAARDKGLTLHSPTRVHETPGSGVLGHVEGHEVAVGGWSFVKALIGGGSFAEEIAAWVKRDGTVAVVVGIDRTLAGAFLFADRVRPESGSVLRHLRNAGVRRIVLVTGDRADLAESVAAFLGVDRVISEMAPHDKIAAVDAERAAGPVMMVGDGINDAPALAAADVGVAMGAQGAAASSEAADIVILVDRLDRLVGAVHIARRSRSIALQSVIAGIGLSVAAMLAAAFGYLSPVEGALLQEAIDVVVILNALRALGRPILAPTGRARLPSVELARLEAEHQDLSDVLDHIRTTAERIHRLPGPAAVVQLAKLDDLLQHRLLPHEKRDDEEIYARIRREAGGADALAGMSRTHMELQRQAHNFSALRRALAGDGPNEAQRHEFQRLLYGLEAVARLHFAQEEEIYRAWEQG